MQSNTTRLPLGPIYNQLHEALVGQRLTFAEPEAGKAYKLVEAGTGKSLGTVMCAWAPSSNQVIVQTTRNCYSLGCNTIEPCRFVAKRSK